MPTVYEYYNAALYAITKISEGLLPSHAVDKANISWAKFSEMLDGDPELQRLYAEADQRGADALADALLTLDDPRNPYHTTDPKKQKVISDNIKWVLARRHNKKYGEKIEIKQEVTIAHVITQQLEQARQRSQQARLDTQVVELDGGEYRMLPPPPPVR